jgi:hypothetical protein
LTYGIVFRRRKFIPRNAAVSEISARTAKAFRPQQRPDDIGPVRGWHVQILHRHPRALPRGPDPLSAGPERIRLYRAAIVLILIYSHM